MPGPLVWGVGIAMATGFGWLVSQMGKKDDDDDEDKYDVEVNGGTIDYAGLIPIEAVTGTVDVNGDDPLIVEFEPATGGGGGGPQAVTWSTYLWGGGGQPMKWPGIRAAFFLYGFTVPGDSDADVNGASCPTPGVGSRGGCPSNFSVKGFQIAFNKLIVRADLGHDFDGNQYFAGKTKLVTDGILGANTLNAMEVTGEAQNLAWGGPFGLGRMQELALG